MELNEIYKMHHAIMDVKSILLDFIWNFEKQNYYLKDLKR